MRVWAYQKGPGRYYRPAYRNIATAIGIEEGAVLDVGCGPGWTSIFMAAGKPHLDAVVLTLVKPCWITPMPIAGRA